MTRELHSIWKEGRKWKVQCPKGILTFNTKRDAYKWVSITCCESGTSDVGRVNNHEAQNTIKQAERWEA